MDSAAPKLETIAQAAGEMAKEETPTAEGAGLEKYDNANSPLLKLPAELRNRIYEALFQEHAVDLSANDLLNRIRKRFRPEKTDHPLLLVCKQVRAEARGLFFSLSTFKTPHAWQVGRIFRNLEPSLMQLITKIDLDNAYGARLSGQYRHASGFHGLAIKAQLELFVFREEAKREGLQLNPTSQLRSTIVSPFGKVALSETPYLSCYETLKNSEGEFVAFHLIFERK